MLPEQVTNEALFSECGSYRYHLKRQWDRDRATLMMISLNPSTMSDTYTNATIVRCTQFAVDWGYGQLILTNLFAFCATHPSELKSVSQPIEHLPQKNDRSILAASEISDDIVVAWGNSGTLHNRAEQVLRMLPPVKCLRINASGQPAHPLYLPKHLTPIPFN